MKTIFIGLVKFSAIILLQLIFVSFALACMCPSSNSVRSEFDKSSNVIIAKVNPYEIPKINLEEKQTDSSFELDLSSITEKMLPKLKVQKVFKGNFKAGEILEFNRVFSCNVVFAEVGEEYLLYLGDKPKQGELWQTPSCSKSGLLENRLADILYISKEKKVRNKTRLAGMLLYDKVLSSKKTKSQLPTLANRRIYIIGTENRFKTKTNENGVYEIYGLPAETYRVYAENIQGFNNKISNFDNDIVEITKSGQYERNFKYKDVSIGEKINNANGLSAKVCSLISRKTK